MDRPLGERSPRVPKCDTAVTDTSRHSSTSVPKRSSSPSRGCGVDDPFTPGEHDRASDRAGTGRPDDRVIVRISMDPISMIGAQIWAIEIAEQAIAGGIAVKQFEQP
jgi:hypothetical protein